MPLHPVFYDFEASGLDGFPIEVGWASIGAQKNILSGSWLIKPDPAWDLAAKWDKQAEEIHHISLAQVMAKGTPVRQVAAALNQTLAGRDLYSDSTFDQKWMGQLFEAAGFKRSFHLKDKPAPTLIDELRAERGFTEDDVAWLYRTVDHELPHKDRAEPDAKHWAALWAALLQRPPGKAGAGTDT